MANVGQLTVLASAAILLKLDMRSNLHYSMSPYIAMFEILWDLKIEIARDCVSAIGEINTTHLHLTQIIR